MADLITRQLQVLRMIENFEGAGTRNIRRLRSRAEKMITEVELLLAMMDAGQAPTGGAAEIQESMRRVQERLVRLSENMDAPERPPASIPTS